MAKKREILSPEQLDANYEKFMKGRELNDNGKVLFDKIIAKAATTIEDNKDRDSVTSRQRGSK